MNASEMITRALRRLDEDATAPQWADSKAALRAINEAQRVFCLVTLCLEKTGTLALTGGTTFYHVLPTLSDFLVPLRVKVAGGARLAPDPLVAFDARSSSWQSAAGTPTRYALLGLDLLAIMPRPAAGGTSLTITYAHAPAVLTTGTNTPTIPEEYHPALVDYAVNRLRFNEGGAEFVKSLAYFERFLKAAQKMAAFVRARSLGARYDRLPAEIEKFDISKLVAPTRGPRAAAWVVTPAVAGEETRT